MWSPTWTTSSIVSLTIRVTGWAKSRSSEPATREGKRQGLVCDPVPEYCDPVLLALRGRVPRGPPESAKRLPVKDPLAARQGLKFGASNRMADTSVSVPLIETAEGDKNQWICLMSRWSDAAAATGRRKTSRPSLWVETAVRSDGLAPD